MDVSAVKTAIDVGNSGFGALTAVNSHSSAADVENKAQATAQARDKDTSKKPVKLDDLQHMTAAMNQFVEAMNTNIHFAIHEKTNELMVQVVDRTNNKVIKEFPSHEFLDTVAAIRSYVGLLLDKRM